MTSATADRPPATAPAPTGRRGWATPPLPSRAEREAAGKALRATCPRKSHAAWTPPPGRADPVELLVEVGRGRIEELLPIRYGRMVQSPFAFYRGAAAVMANDLAHTPATGLRVQACGDCHLLNFGGFATPERRLIIDINDFDETLPAPWEWDLKRLAASFVIAGRSNRFSRRQSRAAAVAARASYRRHMREYAGMPALQVWYASIEGILENVRQSETRRFYKRMLRKEMGRDATSEFAKLTRRGKGTPRIKDDPPLIYHLQQRDDPDFARNVTRTLDRYRDSLADDRRLLFDRFRLQDIAVKVVGVGSVGTMCGVAL